MPNLYPFLTYVFVTTFTPGPNNIISMTNSVRYGYRRTLKFLTGITSGFLVILLLCGVLNVVLVNLVPQIHVWLSLLGAAYMLYLAAHIVFSKPAAESTSQNDFNSFGTGFVLQFVNVKGILYGFTVFALFITPIYHDPLIVNLFALLLAFVAFVAVSSWALGGNLFRGFLSKHERAFNLVMGALLVYIAIASVLSIRV